MSNRRFLISDLRQIKQKLYNLSRHYNYCNIYDSNGMEMAMNKGKYEFLAGYGLKAVVPMAAEAFFTYHETHPSWIFGQLDYHDIAAASVCEGFFYEPRIVVYMLQHASDLFILNNGVPESELDDWIEQFDAMESEAGEPQPMEIHFQPLTSKDEYMFTVGHIREDIIRGKYYEMNYCIAFSSPCAHSELLPYFNQLNEKTSAPFSAFVKSPREVILCSSPERFLMRSGDVLVSQPIKGTNKRLEGEENIGQMDQLRGSEKERAENVMIVDLVRNDLARVCSTGSIHVEELCGTYAFKTVNHLVSTVSGKVHAGSTFRDILYALFPMGSMTGAPKTEVMKHIDLYEHEKRGTYSGCLGYIEPGGDFDFNVIIRSLVYDDDRKTISYKVGSAITYDSVAEEEYEECLLKGKRLFDVMAGGHESR